MRLGLMLAMGPRRTAEDQIELVREASAGFDSVGTAEAYVGRRHRGLVSAQRSASGGRGAPAIPGRSPA